MRLLEFNWTPPDRQLRQFGLMACVIVPLLAWWWGGSQVSVLLPAGVVGGLFAILGVVRPAWLRGPFLTLSLIGWPIGMVVGELALLTIYFGVITPLGIVRRCCGRDGLERRLKPEAKSYWTLKRQPQGPRSYFKQW